MFYLSFGHGLSRGWSPALIWLNTKWVLSFTTLVAVFRFDFLALNIGFHNAGDCCHIFTGPSVSFHITPHFHWSVCCSYLQCSAVVTFSLTLVEKAGWSASPWLTGTEFSPLPPLLLFSNFGEMLPHACMTRRLYAYMLSQIRKTSTRVEQKFGGGDPPLVGDLAALFPQLYHYRVHPKAWRLRRA